MRRVVDAVRDIIRTAARRRRPTASPLIAGFDGSRDAHGLSWLGMRVRDTFGVRSPSAEQLANPALRDYVERWAAGIRQALKAQITVVADVQPFIRRMESVGRQMNDAAYLRAVKRRELAEARDWFDQHVQDIYDDLGLKRPTP
ncbi:MULTISPECIES: hypothetical protein [unclassified Aeromicrobium]|uniref:hypothetical protein n=1 Tax=unclassified Aeromicrobium TaxID=2633570 RepID=UPI0028897176|nr:MULTISPECIES: hypothetical protein [unclassified Aeromicrobium]